MALPDTRAGYQARLYLGTDADPVVYEIACGIETTDFTQSRSEIARPIRDCAQDFAPPVMVRLPGMKEATISGSGLIAMEFIDDLQAAYAATTARYWKVEFEDGPIWAGPFIMTSLQITANADGTSFSDISISLSSAGDITYTAAP